VGLNVAALLAGIELGIQPLLFHDAHGAPLFAPYPLRIAVPAMMIGHLTLAGLAEMIVSGGVFAYMQKANLSLLGSSVERPPAARPGSLRPLWVGLAILMILTPLGLLATGTAWGEWRLSDWRNAAKRAEIQRASSNIAPPARIPAGIARLASVWTAPMPDYAPPLFREPAFGYILSALTGGGVIILVCQTSLWLLGGSLLRRRGPRQERGAEGT
jgi:cobalt/nickel transport system permease protein